MRGPLGAPWRPGGRSGHVPGGARRGSRPAPYSAAGAAGRGRDRSAPLRTSGSPPGDGAGHGPAVIQGRRRNGSRRFLCGTLSLVRQLDDRPADACLQMRWRDQHLAVGRIGQPGEILTNPDQLYRETDHNDLQTCSHDSHIGVSLPAPIGFKQSVVHGMQCSTHLLDRLRCHRAFPRRPHRVCCAPNRAE